MGIIQQLKSKIEFLLSGENRQRFFNFAYSIGAAVVILGALFKILHLPAGNLLLSIGMGTEVLMFILTAFDRPSQEYKWENVFPALKPDEEGDVEDSAKVIAGAMATQAANTGVVSGTMPVGAATGGGYSGGAVASLTVGVETPEDLQQSLTSFAEQMAQLKDTARQLNEVGRVLLDSYKVVTDNSENISANSQGFVRQMDALNRNISGLNTIYEIQLKSVSSQLDSIDRVNRGIRDISDMYETTARQSRRFCEESEQMTRHMQQLNTIYANMLQAMSLGMPVNHAGAIPTPTVTNSEE